jgi:hypothetical protein
MGFLQEARQFWKNYGWHLLLVGLFFTFIVLFIINQWGRNATTSAISFSDIYEHFLGMIFRPHGQPTERQRQRRTQSRGGTSRGETSCKEFIEFYFQKPFAKTRPDFLKNPVTGENLELDMYNEDIRLAVEYNGEQHYKYIPFFHQNKEAFKNQLYRDELKRRMCKDAGVTLIEVPYTIPVDEIESYLKKIIQTYKN